MAGTTYDRLVAAGAPPLAEPLFYRVKFDNDDDLVAEVRETRQRFGSDRLAARYIEVRALQPDQVLPALVEALQAAVGDIRRRELVADFVGEFGPSEEAKVAA